MSEIVKFFDGQTVFLTGGTGFLGKLLIEKLLRCTKVSKIYILIRIKKEKPEAARFQELFENAVFDKMKKENVNYKSFVKLINGDCVKPNLGLSQDDQNEIIKNTTCIIHCAATIRFDQHIKTATYINVRATRDLLKIAQQIPKLKAFVHVSTAYSHCPRHEIEEKFYDTHLNDEKLIQLVDMLDDQMLEEITPKLIKDWPNTYVFTKAVAEEVVRSHCQNIPVTVVRPGQIFPVIYDPIPGWIDNIYGCIGFVVGVGAGILRTVKVNPNVILDLIPADFVINTVLAAAWEVNNQRKNIISSTKIEEPIIFNSVTGSTNPTTLSELNRYCLPCSDDYLTVKTIWWPFVVFTNNKFFHLFLELFLHTLPGYAIDLILVISGKKPMLISAYKKIDKAMSVISYFASKQWIIDDKNTQNLWKKMNEADKNLFRFDTKSIDWKDYYKKGIIGGRIYIFNDPLTTLEYARKKAKVLKTVHYTLYYLLIAFALYSCYFLFTTIYKF